MPGFDLDCIERAMVFGAHPDDEIIGPGGTIHMLSSRGKEIYVVTFTSGGTAANSLEEMEDMIARRKREMEETDKILGVTARELLQIPSQQVYAAVYGGLNVYDADAPNNEMTLHHKLIKLIRKYRPDLVFTHSSDNHRDHCGIADITPQSVFQASKSILGHLGEPWDVPLLLYYPVERELEGEYSPNLVVEIERGDLDAKIAAMETQISQTRGDYLQHFREIMHGRAQLWGAKLFGAGKYAEPFHLGYKTPIRIRVGCH